LLAALFGGQIMTFIFGQLGPDAIGIDDVSATVTNETGAWLNTTTYTVDNSGVTGFSNLVITSAINTTDNSSIGLGNFTVSGAGFTNATATTWPSIWVSYTYNYYPNSKAVSEDIQNESLQSINTYASGSTNQMNVLSIAIILILLIGVFLLWSLIVLSFIFLFFYFPPLWGKGYFSK
jgi:hypothetical protein